MIPLQQSAILNEPWTEFIALVQYEGVEIEIHSLKESHSLLVQIKEHWTRHSIHREAWFMQSIPRSRKQ